MLMRTSRNQSSLDESGQGFATPAAIDPRGIFLLLKWRLRFIVVTALCVAGLTVAALSMMPPKYRAFAVLLIQPQTPRVTQSEAVVSGIGADAAAVESQVELIESTAVAQRVIERLKLDQDPEFTSRGLMNGLGDIVSGLTGGAEKPDSPRAGAVLARFRAGLKVSRRGLTYVLEVGYVSSSPEKAARIANAVAEAYLEDQRSARAEITRRASGWLGDRAEELRERVRVSEQAVADYKTRNSVISITQGNRLIDRQVEDLNQQLTLARSRRADAEARLQRVDGATINAESSAASLSEALQSPTIASLRTQYAEIARLEAENSALFGPRHPSVASIRAQLAGARRQLEAEISRVVQGVRNEFQVAERREKALEADLARVKQQSADAVETDVKLRELERDSQANRTLFEQFLSRSKETNEQETLQIADVRIVTPASPPNQASRPSMFLLSAGAFVFGLLFGALLVLALDHLRRGFRLAGDIERHLALPSLGTLPTLPARRGRRGRLLAQPGSTYAAGLKAVRSRLRRFHDGAPNEILAVVSALPNEGKSTFAANLATAATAAGIRTLLVDGDMYARSISGMYGLSGPGLAQALSGHERPMNVVREGPQTGLHLVGAGGRGPGEINDMRLDDVLGEYREHYELVVLDTPALLATGDGAPLVGCADRALLLVEWERTSRDAVWEALSLLGHDTEKLAGVVLNKVPEAWLGQYDGAVYQGYGQGYGAYGTAYGATYAAASPAAPPRPRPRAHTTRATKQTWHARDMRRVRQLAD